MSTLTELITEHRITATNPFATPWESDQAALRMAKALEAVVETIESLEDQPPFGATSEEQWQIDTEANVARTLRDDLSAALTETKEAGT